MQYQDLLTLNASLLTQLNIQIKIDPFFSTEMARWTARNAVSGPIHVSYHLASETPVGKWRLSANTRSNKQANPSQLRLPVVKYEPVGFEVSRNRILCSHEVSKSRTQN